MEVRAVSLAELPVGGCTLHELNGTRMVLVRAGDRVYACAATCTHQGGPLHEGKLSGTRLTCPWHGWMFDLRSGECVMPSRGGRVDTYPVTIEGGDIWVEIA